MLAVIISDLHLHNYKQFDEKGSRLKNCIAVMENYVFPFCAKNNIKVVLMPGDWYDNQKSLPTSVINASVASLIKLAGTYPDIVIYAISGNHDQASKNLIHEPAETALTHLAEILPANFVLIDDKSLVIGENVYLHGVPYYEYAQDFQQRLKERASVVNPYAKSNILMIHQTPSGLGNPNIPVDTDVLDPLYENFSHTFCGHIHKRQNITPNFTVVGSPIHRDLGDEGEVKGFLIMELTEPDKGYKFISLGGKFPEYQRKSEGDQLVEGEENNYVIWEPTFKDVTPIEQARVEEFNANLSAVELVTNFFKEAHEEDAELLATGLRYVV